MARTPEIPDGRGHPRDMGKGNSKHAGHPVAGRDRADALQPRLSEEAAMRGVVAVTLGVLISGVCSVQPAGLGDAQAEVVTEYTVHPIGYVRKTEDRTTIVVEEKYKPGLLRMGRLSHVWVLWWFDRNDTAEKRSILQVHPQGNPDNPLTGVFATHAPVRPNLIGMTRCKVLSVKDNVIEIDSIDAFADTPVLDLKSG